MIADTMLMVSTGGFLLIIFFKIYNIVHFGEKAKILFSIIQLGLSLFLFLFVLFSQLTAVHASSEQPFYLGEVFEATQYLRFATYMLLAVLGLTLIEVLISFKIIFAERGRLRVETE